MSKTTDTTTRPCAQCATPLDGEGYCTDETCPYSSWPQHVPLEALYAHSTEEVEATYWVKKRPFPTADDPGNRAAAGGPESQETPAAQVNGFEAWMNTLDLSALDRPNSPEQLRATIVEVARRAWEAGAHHLATVPRVALAIEAERLRELHGGMWGEHPRYAVDEDEDD